MGSIVQSGAVTLSGIASTLLTVIVIAAIHAGTGINLFAFSLWVFVPVGAVLAGGFAAFGYYLAASRFNQPPSRALLVQMVVIAAIAQVLIYATEYWLATRPGGPLRLEQISFWDYLNQTLTTSRIVMRNGVVVSPEVGGFGYVLALIQFAGFLCGGLFVFMQLEEQPACGDCGKYLRTVATKRDRFADDDAFGAYYDHEFDHPVDSPEFASHVGKQHEARNRPGMFRLKTTVLGCPSCGSQTVLQVVDYWGARGIQPEDGLTRAITIPRGVDVASAYRG